MIQTNIFESETKPGLTFLEEAYQQIDKAPRPPATTYIILPSVRAGMFYKNACRKFGPDYFILPHITTIYSFISNNASLQLIDSTKALLELYQVYCDITPKAESFSEFYKWGQLLLNDFNEIDNYLIDGEMVYSNLKSIKEIENWSFQSDDLSIGQQNYLEFWNQLGPLYKAFKAQLLAKNLAYSGMQVRQFAHEMKLEEWKKSGSYFYFLGFNALNKAEELIVNRLCDEGLAEVFWDVDDYYLGNFYQEAGKFFASKDRHPKHHYLKGNLKQNELKIESYGVQKNVGQVKLAAAILSKKSAAELSKTAVVLANESLLVPLLNSLPLAVQHINLTMGLPLKENTLHSLFEAMFDLNISAKNGLLNAKELSNITSHHLLYKYFHNNEQMNAWLGKRTHVKHADLLSFLSANDQSSAQCFFDVWQGKHACFEALKRIIVFLRTQQHIIQLNHFENEFLFESTKVIYQLGAMLEAYPYDFDAILLKRLFVDAMRSKKVAFIGEPLRGLQVMGMLETRSLDFEHIILLGANEGIMPANPVEASLIPNDLKRYFNLPTFEKREAIYAYYVYRLLQRAKRVSFVHNNVLDELGGSEKSRFLLQIEEELLAYNPKISFENFQVRLDNVSEPSFNRSIKKTIAIRERLKSLLQAGLSPSAINTFVNCPLDFYYKYVLRYQEPDRVEEVSNAELGSIVHRVLELAYASVINKVLTLDFVKAEQAKIDTYLTQAFAEILPHNELSGRTLLSFTIAKRQLHNFFEQEASRIKDLASRNEVLSYLATEETMDYTFSIHHEGENIPVKIKGRIDRIDRVGNLITVIDYKTGKVDKQKLSFSNWNELASKTAKKYALQLACYGLALSNDERYKHFDIQTAVVSMLNLKSGPIRLARFKNEVIFNQEQAQQAEATLHTIVSAMLDNQSNFEHDKHARYCVFCN